MPYPILHPFEKTSTQLRYAIKRLETLIKVSKDPQEVETAKELLKGIKELRKVIPTEYQDTDIKE